MTIVPTGIGFRDWADHMSVELFVSGAVPVPPGEEDWRWWAREVVSVPAIERLQPPDPGAFADWRSWAYKFVETFGSG